MSSRDHAEVESQRGRLCSLSIDYLCAPNQHFRLLCEKKSGPFDNWHNVKPYQKDGELMQKEGLCFPVLECLTSGLQ